MTDLLLVEDDLSGPEIQALLRDHLASMHEHSPAGSVHALDVAGLRAPGVDLLDGVGRRPPPPGGWPGAVPSGSSTRSAAS